MRPPPFILVRKSNTPRGPQTGAPGDVFLLELNGLDYQDYRVMTAQTAAAPHTAQRRSSTLDMGTASILTSKTAHRAHTAATGCLLVVSTSPPGVGAGHARKGAGQPLAASQVLCLPHPGWVKTIFLNRQPPDELLQAQHRAKSFLLNFPIGARPFLCFICRKF